MVTSSCLTVRRAPTLCATPQPASPQARVSLFFDRCRKRLQNRELKRREITFSGSFCRASSSNLATSLSREGCLGPRAGLGLRSHAMSPPQKIKPVESSDELFSSADAHPHSVEVERVTAGLQLEREASRRADKLFLPRLLDASGVLQDAASAIIDDTFNKCFTFTDTPAWNWNFYLFPMWCVGVLIRYLVLFPLRLTFVVLATILFLVTFTAVHSFAPNRNNFRVKLERFLVNVYAACHVVSWTGVIRHHGPKPTNRYVFPNPGLPYVPKTVPRLTLSFLRTRPGHIFVANHTSIIDYIILTSVSPFSSIAQQNKGWVGLIQNTAMDAIDCIRFDRAESKDREMVVRISHLPHSAD